MCSLTTDKSSPDIARAKEILIEAVQLRQKTLEGIRPPDPAKAEAYKLAIEKLEANRGAKIWYPYLGSGIGHGSYVELMDGSVKLDFIGGIGVHHFGHGHPEVLSSSIDAAISDVVMQGHLQQNLDQAELIELLVSESGLPHCFLTSSGSMANENALKIACQKNQPAKRILAFERNFCGRSWAMAQITEKPDVRQGLPVSLPVDYIPFFDEKRPEESIKEAVSVLKRHLWRYPKDHAMMVFEMIQGEGGYYPGNRAFFVALMEILKDSGVAVFIDEIQTFGRTSKLFAYQHYELQDYVDIVSIGKLSQTCATLFTNEYAPKPGLLSQTFTSSTSAIHAAKTIIRLMKKEGFFENDGKNMQIHRHFVNNFEALHQKHPDLLNGPYGLGGMVAFTPLDGDMKRVIQFGHTLFEKGVISFICGKDPTRIRFLVPMGSVKPAEIDLATQLVEEALLCS